MFVISPKTAVPLRFIESRYNQNLQKTAMMKAAWVYCANNYILGADISQNPHPGQKKKKIAISHHIIQSLLFLHHFFARDIKKSTLHSTLS